MIRNLFCTLLAGLALAGVAIVLYDAGAEEPSAPAQDAAMDALWTPAGTPEPAGGEPEGEETDWSLILVNQWNPLPADFSVELTALKNGHAIDERAYPDLQAMMDAARAEGLSPLICSSYRTQEKQTALYQAEVARWLARGYGQSGAERQAARWVAPPGVSEHQTGLAVDIVAASYQLLDEGQEDTAEQRWLMENAWKYGFILRYPSEKSALTGIGYEPWHYRYVGKRAAREIAGRGLCLEEYLEEAAAPGAGFEG